MKKSLLFAAAVCAAMTANADYYVVGANVNGQTDWTGTEMGKLQDMGNGIYRWEGTELGSGFKINGGNGDWNTHNIGNNGSEVENGEPYDYYEGSDSGNIPISAPVVMNPVLVLDENEKTFTLTGEFGGEFDWFVAGINDSWIVDSKDPAANWLKKTDEEGVFACDVVVTAEEGSFKISTTGWTEEWGTQNPEEVFVDADHLTVELEEVGGEAGNLSYVLTPDTYKFKWDYNTKTLVIIPSSSVAAIEAGEAEGVYYNLQGVRVSNPVNGVYVKVAGKNVSKVLVKK